MVVGNKRLGCVCRVCHVLLRKVVDFSQAVTLSKRKVRKRKHLTRWAFKGGPGHPGTGENAIQWGRTNGAGRQRGRGAETEGGHASAVSAPTGQWRGTVVSASISVNATSPPSPPFFASPFSVACPPFASPPPSSRPTFARRPLSHTPFPCGLLCLPQCSRVPSHLPCYPYPLSPPSTASFSRKRRSRPRFLAASIGTPPSSFRTPNPLHAHSPRHTTHH